MAKNNVRSFRYDDDIKEILENFPGQNMNDKFEGLVRYCHTKLPETEKQLKELERQITTKQRRLKENVKDIHSIETILNELHKVKHSVEVLAERTKLMVDGPYVD